jgi:hypothetical protein
MRHIPAVLILLVLLLFVMAPNVAPDPYLYDEADYMYAASLGFLANYTDTPTLPIADFVRTGLARGMDAGQRQALSERIRASDDVIFYRHWHGPLYLYVLISVSHLGLNEQLVRSAMLVIPALTLAAIYFGCVWLIPGLPGAFAALAGGVLFLSSRAVTGSTELAPHHLFACISVCFLFLLAKAVATAQRVYWYGAVVAAGLAFCTLEIAFVLVLTLAVSGYAERRRLEIGWRMAGRSLALFVATVLVAWPAGIYKLSFVKGYLFMAYLALFRKSPWGQEGFFETWRGRILDSPLEWAAILASLAFYFRGRAGAEKRLAYPILIYIVMMVAVTARILTGTPRYSLLFMPALDIFCALTLVPFLAAMSRRAVYIAAALFCGLLGVNGYRLFARPHNPDPRPPAVLNYIREHGRGDQALLIPQDDLPMIHYYFPGTHLRGYYGIQPERSDLSQFTPDGILYRGYPVRIESPR